MTIQRATFYPDVLVEVPECPLPVVRHHILQTLVDFCTKTRLVTETLPAINVVADQGAYVVQPATAKMQIVRVEQAWFNGEPLDPVSVDELDAEVRNWRTDTGVPRLFTSEDGESDVQLVPVPSSSVTGGLKVKVSIAPDPTTDIDAFDPVLYRRFSRGIAAGIKSRLMSISGKPWSNPAQAKTYEGEYQVAVSSARLLARKGLARSRQRTTSYFR